MRALSLPTPKKGFLKEELQKVYGFCFYVFTFQDKYVKICDLFSPENIGMKIWSEIGKMIFVKFYASQKKYKKKYLFNSMASSWIY